MLSRIQSKSVKRSKRELEELRYKHRLIIRWSSRLREEESGLQDIEMVRDANCELRAISLMLNFVGAWVKFLHLLVICFCLARLSAVGSLPSPHVGKTSGSQ